jgi:hypothetical protein
LDAIYRQHSTLIASPSNSIDTTICSLLTPTFPHRSFADIQPYLESIALDTLQFASDSASNMKWSQESLIGLIQKWPDLLDSSAVISAYYDSASSLSYAKLMQVFTKMQSYTDTRNKNEYKALNSGTTPIDDNETNLQVINGLYLKYFMGTMDSIFPSGNLMDSTDLNSVYNVASQCYLSGGPAVYLARSMYAVAIMDDSTQFSDDCTIYAARMSYASNSNEVKTALVDSIYTFKIYPNPMDRENGVNVQSSEVGEITFYNLLGQITYKARLSKGITIFDCVQLSCENNIILYRAKLQSGKTETGKIIVLK